MAEKTEGIKPGQAADKLYPGEQALIEGLRRGDESVILELVNQYHNSMVRVARLYVFDGAAAEEVVQDTWVGVLQGIYRFEGRSSLKTWIFKILTNQAKRRRIREARSIPFSRLGNHEALEDGSAGELQRLLPPRRLQLTGYRAALPKAWSLSPENRLLSQETMQTIRRAIESLPDQQRVTLSLHDLEGWTPQEVRRALHLSETNQRVLLHRARSRVRKALASYFDNDTVH